MGTQLLPADSELSLDLTVSPTGCPAMAASLSRPCFLSLHVPYGQGCAQDLAAAFRFQPVAVRETPRVRQLALRRGAAVFLLNERLAPAGISNRDFLYDVDPRPTLGTASNVCLEVDDVPRLCAQLQSRGCTLPVPPIEPMQGAPPGDGVEISHFDHITYVCPRGGTQAALEWYQHCFGFRHFSLSQWQQPARGFVLGGHGAGMLLRALQSSQGSGCKLVLAESLSESVPNQVDTFLEQHGGAGIQHVGLRTPDIVSATRALQRAGVRFFTPPAAYYSQRGKEEEVRGAGQDPCTLAELGILLDTAVHGDNGQLGSSAGVSPAQSYLMQIFTHPLFSEETFFLELIERHGAPGFGEGNIRALWKAVQVYMDQRQ
ncbi:4-hydroxyphenylpyruvate dioxygenase-like protein isoform X2 [Centrocercus urophasianus]|uniref:4-hydroxyphenylpyruvate dioxygenase-like protein isoform X2 n=1 Tax=Centrocercus urophasianus TaxID=9002 RepID=UPI001C64A68B|nr:4-hydroxyphenylpyruvate dioxygenase-like protein isoform X2 [Centrocercus urophasianus]